MSPVGHELHAAQKQPSRQRVDHAVGAGVWIYRGAFPGGTGSTLASMVDWRRCRWSGVAAVFGRGLLAAPARFGRRLARLAAILHLLARGDVVGFIVDALADFAGADSEHMADRKSTRLNSSHSQISYAVFCLKKKKSYKTFC